MKRSEKFALSIILLALIAGFSVNIVMAGDKGSFGHEKTIDIHDLSTWNGVPSITDSEGDIVDSGTPEANLTDIKEVWICNNYTYLFVRIDVVGELSPPGTAPYFAIQLYTEDVKHKADNSTKLFMDYANGPITENDINASFLFSKWSQGGYCRFNYSSATSAWKWDQDLTDPETQGAYNWTVNGHSFVMMIHLELLSSTGKVNSGDSFKFDIFTIYSPDGNSWYAEDYLDFATYSLTGDVIPEFATLIILLLTLISTTTFVVFAKKRKLIPKI